MAKEQEQWRGAVEARLPSTPAAAAWPHVADFFSLHRYLPGIDVCERETKPDGVAGDVDGVLRPGCVRYCASLAHEGGGSAGEPAENLEVATWAREELVELDPRARRLAYAVVGSNMGFGRYVASMTVLPANDAVGGEASGCRLVWAFECDPVDGWSRDGLLAYLDGSVKSMAARIEEEEASVAACAAVPAAGGGAVAA